jgi:MOSC domain-containing protein YiiM
VGSNPTPSAHGDHQVEHRLRLGDPLFVRRFAQVSRPGAYLRIVEEGDLGVGDSVAVDLASLPDHGVSARGSCLYSA